MSDFGVTSCVFLTYSESREIKTSPTYTSSKWRNHCDSFEAESRKLRVKGICRK